MGPVPIPDHKGTTMFTRSPIPDHKGTQTVNRKSQQNRFSKMMIILTLLSLSECHGSSGVPAQSTPVLREDLIKSATNFVYIVREQVPDGTLWSYLENIRGLTDQEMKEVEKRCPGFDGEPGVEVTGAGTN